ncbi:hypothetical protein FJT64_002127 [Amphibalanus amphitrite]|uniref:Uncharacterized protein n=1 Tax=Amphibalanus amphitrite TaxID=1232801 RepID=A0A6A4WMX7_AMPAM|nr:hypothetical protein FJT64_002127 [Amphibalanus amphitrite]
MVVRMILRSYKSVRPGVGRIAGAMAPLCLLLLLLLRPAAAFTDSTAPEQVTVPAGHTVTVREPAGTSTAAAPAATTVRLDAATSLAELTELILGLGEEPPESTEGSGRRQDDLDAGQSRRVSVAVRPDDSLAVESGTQAVYKARPGGQYSGPRNHTRHYDNGRYRAEFQTKGPYWDDQRSHADGTADHDESGRPRYSPGFIRAGKLWGSVPGTTGLDYPNLTQVPLTRFTCKHQYRTGRLLR